MSVWKFTTAAGEAYELQGPPGATYDQAQAVFNKQLNSGGLVGISVGGLVNAVTQSIDGLSTAPAYIGPQAVSVAQQQGGYVALPTQPGATVATAINTSDFVNTQTVSQTIGTVSSAQVQGLVATTAASVGQSSNVITNLKGLGSYGLTADQLQTAGLIKPGIADQVRQDPANAVSILSSPTSWTGKQGATDINVILNDVGLQTATQQGLMENTFNQLKQNGTITGTEAASTVGPLVNAGTKFGVNTLTKSLNLSDGATAAAVGVIGFIASSSFGGTFGSINQSLSGGGSALSSGTVEAKGYTNTVNRVNVNQAMKAIIGNPKIPTPYFQSAGTSTSNPAGATAAVQSAISTLVASGLTGEQIVEVINSRSTGADRISTYGGILRTADGAPVTDRTGNPISIGGTSPVLGSGITAADKAAMFGGAASAVTGTTNDGVPSTNTTTATTNTFTSSFNNAATQKALISSALSGSPTAVIGAITSAALNAAPTQSATPAVSGTVNATVNSAVNTLKAYAASDPKAVSAALKVATLAASAFGPIGSLIAGVLNSTLTPTINQALAVQAQQDSINAFINAPVLNTADLVAFESAEVASAESQAENDGGFGTAPTLSNEGLSNAVDGQDAANARDSDPAQFGGNDPPSNDNGSYSNSLTRSDSDGGGDGGP